jgi:peptidoglycan hydrolase-like protein with peptidoglycan-binding domain
VQDARDRDVTCPAMVGRAAVPDPLTGLLGSAYQKGDSGSRIRTLQRGMNMRSQYVSGVFDDRTERVLLAFQRVRTFPLTGVATDLELRALGAGTVTPAVPTRLPTVFSAHP